jgi:hypothetical protein
MTGKCTVSDALGVFEGEFVDDKVCLTFFAHLKLNSTQFNSTKLDTEEWSRSVCDSRWSDI